MPGSKGGEEALDRSALIVVAGELRRGSSGEPATVRAAQRGFPDAVEALVREHWGDAYRLALGVVADSSLAEDVAQEGMLDAVRNLSRFDRKRPFRPWLHRIVVNRAIDQIRARGRQREIPLDSAAVESLPAPLDAHDLGLSAALTDALMALDERQRAVVTLRHVLGYSAGEVGRILDLTETNVRSILHRSLNSLRAALREQGTPKESGDE